MASMVGKYKIFIDTANLADGDQIAAYLTDAAGALLTSTLIGGKQRLDVNTAGEFAEDTAHVSGDFGNQVLAVRNDVEGSLVDTDGDYAPLQVDALGRLRVNADINVNNDFVYAEDSASASGHLGASVLLVRQDTLATSTSTDGDYGDFKSNAAGELYVADSAARTTLTAILADTATIDSQTLSIQNTLLGLSHAEDAPHVSGDAGIEMLAVRNDVLGSLVNANGDYAPLQVDANGSLRVVGTIAIAGQYAEDSAAVSGDIGLFSLGVRRDTTGAQTNASGDYSEIQTWSNGELKVVNISNSSALQQQVSVTSTAAAVPTAALAIRKTLLLQNTGSAKVWIGSATVTTSGATAGIELPVGDVMELEVGPAVPIFAVKNGAGGSTLNVLETA